MKTPGLLARLAAFVFLAAGFLPASSAADAAPVTLTEVDETIPTYRAGPPDPNPMFYFGRQSQGAEGRIYPYPLYDNLTNEKGSQTYHLVYLENEFVKIAVAPELGGRLFSAVDKTNGYDFVYQQHVIKPALIGLIGAWISGGIEWNIPHHHRASTFSPVQWRAESNADGSKTIWVGELEIRHRMRWAVGYTLHPASSVLTCSLRIVNRTPLAQTMLCFANVAVNANENYQIIFPPSTQWVTHHTKREFTTWPIATQPYGGVNWDKVDVSWYKNHANSNSMFAWNYEDDFFAGYDHGKQAGTMSIADHHIVPGKKFWTWGNAARGRMWDNILTDTDGPYVELMVGAYSDNQPDYSWLAPFETRAFDMSWYPFRDIGGVKNANLDAAVNVEVKDGTASFGFNTTRDFPAATVRLTLGDKVLAEEKLAISPAKPFAKKIALPAGADPHALRATLVSAEGRELIAYSPIKLAPLPQPPIYTPPPAPKDIANPEELFLAGQRADQFHSPTLDADPFWAEALRRDPGDIEANTGMGRLALRRAKFADAEKYFRIALTRLTASYTIPKNAEPLYYLGVALKAQGKNDEAFDAFFKATWSQEWKSPAYFSLAEIASVRGDFAGALKFADQSLDANALNIRAYALKSAMLRHLDRKAEALKVVALATAKTDPLDLRLFAERAQAESTITDESRLLSVTAQLHPAALLETASEYANAGLWTDGITLLTRAVTFIKLRNESAKEKTNISPLVYYYLADFAEKLGDATSAAKQRREAGAAAPDYVFPFQAELIPVLRRAIAANPSDARAPYYLGNLLFDWQPDEAVALWEKSVALDPNFPIAWRNLAQAYSHRPDDASRVKAIACLEKSAALPTADATQFAELDALYELAGAPVEKRLALLESHRDVVLKKDEGRAALVGLKTVAGKTDEAIALLEGRVFSVWEGGTRFNTGDAWTNAHLARGIARLGAGKGREALADFEVALKFPANLRSSERPGGASRTAEVGYWTGRAYAALGEANKARAAWTEAAANPPAVTGGRGGGGGGRGGAAAALANRANRYFQALALRQLGQTEQADPIFRELIAAGTQALTAAGEPADAAPGPGPAVSPRARTAAAHYLAGLGYAGAGDHEKARAEFTAALTAAPDHFGAKLALGQL